MDYRAPLKTHTVLAFEGMSCHIENIVGQGSNAIVYKGWYQDNLNQDLRHHVLVKELFPVHPQKKIYRAEDGRIIIDPDAEDLWETHRESFETGNKVHLRLLYDHPDMMVMGANLNSFQYNGSLYSILGYTGGRSLQTELNKGNVSLRKTVQRMTCLLDALEAFHKSGYLHLDISPDNIMLVGQEDQERIFLIDYNSTREIGCRTSNYMSYKVGYSAPEVSTGNLDAMGFASDLYSVAAVFFRCVMGRSLSLTEILRSRAPDGQNSPILKDVPQTVSSMVGAILKKGLHTLPGRRYQSIGQMRQTFQELLDRIDCVGVTHWSLWESGKRSAEELVKINPSLRYLKEKSKLYPIRLEKGSGMSLEQYLDDLLSPKGRSGLILAQGGMGKTTFLLHSAMLQGRMYSSAVPAFFFISLNGWNKGHTHYICTQILMRLRFKQENNSYDSAMHALYKQLGQTIKTKYGEKPTVVLLLDGLNEIRGDIAPLVHEINELNKMAGVRILAASRSEIPELNLETVKLMPLKIEDIENALGRNGLMIPQKLDVIQLLRTPLILSIYIQACEGGKQLDIQSEEQLMKAYMDSLLEKEICQLPEDSPQRWQIDSALNYVLPAIAMEGKRKNSSLTQMQLMRVVEQCWKTIGTRRFMKTYPQWIGHRVDICAGAESAEEWFGLVIHNLLWQRLGMLTKDDADGYRIFHQAVAEHLAEHRVPLGKRTGWIAGVGMVLLCAVLLIGYQQNIQKKGAEEEIREALQLGAVGYVEYGRIYEQLQKLVNYAINGDTGLFQIHYDRLLTELQLEQERTKTEVEDVERVAKSSVHDQLRLNWGEEDAVYEYTVLSDLLVYPDKRAAFYAEQLPLLKSWTESEALREKTPEFANLLMTLLEADASLAAEMYHIAVGVHLPAGEGQEIWVESIHDAVALVDALDSHRRKIPEEDRGSRLSSLSTRYEKAKLDFGSERSTLDQYIKNLSRIM